MTDEPPLITPSPATPEPERFPFWGYGDVGLAAAFSIPCMLVAAGSVRLVIWAFGLHHVPLAAQSVPETIILFVLLFLGIKLIFRTQYDRPLFRSLGWVPSKIPVLSSVFWGVGTTVVVAMVGALIRTPPPTGPLIEMMKDRRTLLLLGVVATTFAPVCEELIFRGFLQPLFVRTLGVAAGIGLTSAIFGGLHFSEYGNSWRSALMVAVSGVSFGCLRHFTGSTRASAIAHATFNLSPFLVAIFGKNAL